MAVQKRKIEYEAEHDASVVVKPTNNPTVSVDINPTIFTPSASARGLLIDPTFTGGGVGPAGLGVLPTFTPSGSISEADGVVMNCKMNPALGITISTGIGLKAKISTGGGEGAVTEAFGMSVELPELGTLKPTTTVGLHIGNQGAAGVTASVGIDVLEQKSSTTNIGVRIAKSEKYALQLSDTGGTTAGGIEFGTDTNIHRTAAGVVKVENIVDVETGFRVAGAAAAGKYLRGDGTNFISATLKGTDLEAESVETEKIKKEAVTEEKLAKAVQEKLGFPSTVAMTRRKEPLKLASAEAKNVLPDTATHDPGSNFKIVGGFYEVPSEGYYHVSGSVAVKMPATGTSFTVECFIALGGVAAMHGSRVTMTTISSVIVSVVSGLMFCKAKEKIELWAAQTNSESKEVELTAENREERWTKLHVIRVA